MKEKKELRNFYRTKRKNISQKKYKDNKIFDKVQSLNEMDKYNTVLIYVSTSEEVDTINMIKYFLKTKKVGVPKVIDNEIVFCYIESLDELEKGYFGILEPINDNYIKDFSNCIIIVPGICFSKDGYRIGYGGGFYDRFFKNHSIFSIGLCYRECLIESFNIDETDKSVDVVITD